MDNNFEQELIVTVAGSYRVVYRLSDPKPAEVNGWNDTPVQESARIEVEDIDGLQFFTIDLDGQDIKDLLKRLEH